jgi:hypothetical protein
MHMSLTSREQDLDATPTHQRLLSNLGILAKSQTHSDALHTLLKKDNNHDHRAPANPNAMIRRASPDMTLTPAQRKRAQREDSRQEDKQLRRMSEARANGGITDEDDEEIGQDGHPTSSGSSLSKSMHKGSFQRLRVGVQALMKAQSSDHTDGFATRYGMPTAHVTHVAGRTAVVKPTIAALSKSIETTRQRLDQILGVTPMQNLNKKIVATSEKLAKSLPTGPVRGLRMAAPQYSVPQVEAAAGAALSHNVLTGEQAQTIANCLTLGGVGAVPSELMAKLRGE